MAGGTHLDLFGSDKELFFPFPTSSVYTPLTQAQAKLRSFPDLSPPFVPSKWLILLLKGKPLDKKRTNAAYLNNCPTQSDFNYFSKARKIKNTS